MCLVTGLTAKLMCIAPYYSIKFQLVAREIPIKSSQIQIRSFHDTGNATFFNGGYTPRNSFTSHHSPKSLITIFKACTPPHQLLVQLRNEAILLGFSRWVAIQDGLLMRPIRVFFPIKKKNKATPPKVRPVRLRTHLGSNTFSPFIRPAI